MNPFIPAGQIKGRGLLYVGILILIICAGIYFFYLRQAAQTSSSREVIKIGFVGPLTGFGASWGEEQKHAVELAVDEINTADGVIGRKIEVIYEDGKCEGKTASLAAQKLVSIDRVDLLVSICSAETLAVGKIADTSHVVLMGMWATNPEISGMSPYVFRNSYSDDDIASIMAKTIAKKYTTIGIITELGDYSAGVRNAFKKHFSGELYSEDYQPNTTDVRTQVTKLLSHSPQAIFINPNTQTTAVAVINQLSTFAYKGALFINYFGSFKEIEENPYVDGMIFPADPAVNGNALKDRLFEEYRKKYGNNPTLEFAVAVSYDSIYALKEAVQAMGSTDSDKLQTYLHSLKDFHGVLGTYGFNEKGDATGYQPSLKVIHGGKAVSI